MDENNVTVYGQFTTAGESSIDFEIRSASILVDAGVPFTSDHVGKYVALKAVHTGTYTWEGPYEVTEFISSSRVRLDTITLCRGDYADQSDDTAYWCLIDVNEQLGDVFYSSTMDALSNLVQVGDDLTISGYTATGDDEDLDGTWEITEVLDADRVRIDIDPPFGVPSPAMSNQEDLTWGVHRTDVDTDKLFYAPDGQFLTSQVEAGDKLYIDDGTGADVGSSFTVDEVLSQTTLLTTSAFSGNETDLEWHISPSTTDFFKDPDVLMSTGILGDGLDYELTITTSAPVGQAGDYAIDEDEVETYTPEDHGCPGELRSLPLHRLAGEALR